MATLKPIHEEFIAWLLMDKRTRTVHGMPLTQEEWANYKGLVGRTVRRWKTMPEFKELYEQRKVENARRLMPNSTVMANGPRAATDARSRRRFEPPGAASEQDDPTFDEDLSPEEQDYAKSKDVVIRLAHAGDAKFMDIYLKTYGKQFVEAELSAGSMLQQMGDGELADELVRTLGPDRVAAALARSTEAA